MVFRGLRVARDSERAAFSPSTLTLWVESASHGVIVAGGTEHARAASACDEGDRATEHALPINELISMRCAHILALSQLEDNALFATQVLLAEILLRVHSMLGILHATKVWLLAPDALVEGGVVDCEFFQLAIVFVTRCHDSTLLVISFFSGHLHAQKADKLPKVYLLVVLVGEAWDVVVELHQLLAGWAVKVAETDFQSCPPMCQHHQSAIRMEYVATGQSDAWLLTQLICVTHAS